MQHPDASSSSISIGKCPENVQDVFSVCDAVRAISYIIGTDDLYIRYHNCIIPQPLDPGDLLAARILYELHEAHVPHNGTAQR